jgi:hypothetical protein
MRPSAVQQRCLARPQLLRGVKCQERAGVTQRLGASRLIELGEIYDSACAGESVGNDRLTLALSSKATTSGGRLSSMHSQVARLGSRRRAQYV